MNLFDDVRKECRKMVQLNFPDERVNRNGYYYGLKNHNEYMTQEWGVTGGGVVYYVIPDEKGTTWLVEKEFCIEVVGKVIPNNLFEV